jgi:hypothetical protein
VLVLSPTNCSRRTPAGSPSLQAIFGGEFDPDLAIDATRKCRRPAGGNQMQFTRRVVVAPNSTADSIPEPIEVDPANKTFAAICGGVLLATAGIVAWLVWRGKKLERAQAMHDAAMRARVPETPSQRPESTSSATGSSSQEAEREPAPTVSAPSVSEPTASESAASEPEVDANEPAGPIISVGNRRRVCRVPPAAVVEIKTPRLKRPGAFTVTRDDVKLEQVDGGPPDHVRFRLVGPPGEVGLALLEEDDSEKKWRTVTGWKFELVAA